MTSSNIGFGFRSTLGSFGALALIGVLAIVGILLIVNSKDKKTGERNNVMFISGIVIIVSTALPMLPYVGLGFALDELSSS